MNRVRSLSIAAVLMFAFAALAQQATQSGAPAHKMPSVDDHLKMLSEKLDLTAEQQEQIRPVLAEMQASMQKVMNDQSLSREERHQQMKAAFDKANKQAAQYLTEEQNKKLVEMEQESHSGQHGATHGSQPPQ